MAKRPRRERKGQQNRTERPQNVLNRVGAAAFLVLCYAAVLTVLLFAGVEGTRMAQSWWHLSLGLSVLVGLGAAVLASLFLSSSGNSVMEQGIPCLVLIALTLVLFPIFSRARDINRAHHQVVSYGK